MSADDDASSALIAQLLFEDSQYQANPYMEDDEEQDFEDDYMPDHIKQMAKKRKRIPKTTKPKAKGEPREKKQKVEGMNQGKWQPDEEAKFKEGLELFGRNWMKLAEHIATREPANVRSHAQKYFIKLFKDQTPLPAKVLESGEGYTLSGKPLDPNSGAAQAYTNPMAYRKKIEEQNKAKEEGKKPEDKDETKTPEAENKEKIETDIQNEPEKKKIIPKKDNKPFRESDILGGTKKIQEVLSKGNKEAFPPRRESSYPKRNYKPSKYSTIDANSDPLELVKCESWSTDRQPYTVHISKSALFVADFHAHLARTEIIGLFAGTWDSSSKELTILESFPCSSLPSNHEDCHVNVEMDPSSEVEVREMIKSKNLQVVGWYHSHPVFEPEPSVKDIENQENYQNLFQDSETNTEPFIGVIVAPFDLRLPTPFSEINYFCVQRKNEFLTKPMKLHVNFLNDKNIENKNNEINKENQNNENINNENINNENNVIQKSNEIENFQKKIDTENGKLESSVIQDIIIDENLKKKLLDLIEYYKNFPTKTNFNEIWKMYQHNSEKDSDENSELKPVKKIEKLKIVLESKIPNNSEFIEEILKKLQWTA